jgi:molybdopterin molybdotransferase
MDAYGRVLTSDIVALRSQPPADVSAMDGYAVRAADVAAAPARLKVIGEVAAGHPFARTVGPGEAVRIFTGALLPAGADTVVIQENTTAEGNSVLVSIAADVALCSWRKGAGYPIGTSRSQPR